MQELRSAAAKQFLTLAEPSGEPRWNGYGPLRSNGGLPTEHRFDFNLDSNNGVNYNTISNFGLTSEVSAEITTI